MTKMPEVASHDHHEKPLSKRAKRRLPLWHVELIKEQLIVWDALLLKCQHGPVREGACSAQNWPRMTGFKPDRAD